MSFYQMITVVKLILFIHFFVPSISIPIEGSSFNKRESPKKSLSGLGIKSNSSMVWLDL